jgi:aldehyde dehydrogenase (NAD+)
VCIISPWNFPIQLVLNPAVGALAAGNAVVAKPSEVSAASAALLGELVPKYLDADAFKVIQGGVAETTELLRQRFDHIMYTGNEHVARVVMRAAAENLTPVTLELGGKSPVIVDATANLEFAAAHILSGKCMNAGQVCLSPDYVLVDRTVQAGLTDKLKAAITKFYGDDPAASADFGRIVNKHHFARVKKLLDGAGGTIAAGGAAVERDLYVAPTLIVDPPPTSKIMQEEIFGPLLPIVGVDSIEEAISIVNSRPKPLALYIFSSSSANTSKILANTSSGGACVNETVLHNGCSELPFGGVGISGMGAYHGKWGFDAMSHHRPVLCGSTLIDNGPFRFPPYSKRQLAILNALVLRVPTLPALPYKNLLILGLSVAVAVLSAKVAGKF